MGNVNWMRARESQLASELFGLDSRSHADRPPRRLGLATRSTNVLELLMLAGRPLPHAAMMMIPEPTPTADDLPATSRASTSSTRA